MKFFCVLFLTALLRETGAAATCYTGLGACSSCGGSCTTDNGCICADGIETCLPSSADCLIGDNTCCPVGYYWHSDIGCCSDVLNCIPSCQNDEYCQNVSGSAACACNTTMYSNLNESSLIPNVKCESTLMTISLSKCVLYSLGYDSSNMVLNNNSETCIFSYTDIVNSIRQQNIQAKPLTGWCGNVVKFDTSKLYYTNTLHIGIRNQTIITRNPLNLDFSCSYNLTMQTSLAAAFRPVVNSVNLTVSGEGSITTTMAVYYDTEYAKPVLETDNVPVASSVYLGVFSESVDTKNFVLRVEDCFATPDGDANNVNKVYLVRGGCSAYDGVQTAVEENGVSLESRIKISAFAFQNQDTVYITCNVRLCSSNGTCTGCNLGRAAGNGEGILQVKFNMLGDYDYANSGSHTAVSWIVLAGSLFILLSNKLF